MRRGQRVICEHGVLWLTQSGDATDYLLPAGESFTAQARGHVVAQALEDSRLRVEEPLAIPPHPARPAHGSR